MPSLEDLKSEPVNGEVKKKPFIPTIKETKSSIPTIQQGQSEYGTIKKKIDKSVSEKNLEEAPKRRAVAPRSISMTTGKSIKKADLSEVPEGSDVPKGMEVKTVKNIEEEMLGPGSPFEKMKKEMLEQYKNDFRALQQKTEEHKAARKEAEREQRMETDNGSAVMDDTDEVYTAMDDNDQYYDNHDVIYEDPGVEYGDEPEYEGYEETEPLQAGEPLESEDDSAYEDSVMYEEPEEEFEEPEPEPVKEEAPAPKPEPVVHHEEPKRVETPKPQPKVEVEQPKVRAEVKHVEKHEEKPVKKEEPKQQEAPKFVDKQIVELDNADTVEDNSDITDGIEVIHEDDEPVKLDENTYIAVDDESNSKDEGDSDDINVYTDEQRMESLKALVSKKIAPVSRKLNLSGFKVATKGTTSNEFLNNRAGTPVAKWILPATGIIIQMKEISGGDIENIRSAVERNDIRTSLEIIYNHIVSPKPKSFEVWLRSTASVDYDQLFMAVYIASFMDSNYMPLDCVNPKCNKTFLTDNIKISDMLHYTSEENKKKFLDLYRSDKYQSSGLYASEIIPISDRFAIGFKEPSLYDIYIERKYFDNDFINKYERTINFLPYINKMYIINYDSKELIPIAYKGYKNDIRKTVRSKVERYDSILNTFDADENSIISAYIDKIDERTEWVTFRIPETTCPFCGAKHPESGDVTAASMVFLRSRLATLAIS